jgi:hypothetical protein
MIMNSKLKKKLSSKKGELIAETAMSFLVLAILVASVFMVLTRAMSMTSDSAKKARISQEGEVNPAILMEYPCSVPATIEFRIGAMPIASHAIEFNTMHPPGTPAADCPTCANFPGCHRIPCDVCCGCNNAIAFSPSP